MAKGFTKTVKSSTITAYGVNPANIAAGMISKEKTVIGDYNTFSAKQKEKIKASLQSLDFAVAIISFDGKYTEKKYFMTFEKFIEDATEVSDGENIEDSEESDNDSDDDTN